MTGPEVPQQAQLATKRLCSLHFDRNLRSPFAAMAVTLRVPRPGWLGTHCSWQPQNDRGWRHPLLSPRKAERSTGLREHAGAAGLVPGTVLCIRTPPAMGNAIAPSSIFAQLFCVFKVLIRAASRVLGALTLALRKPGVSSLTPLLPACLRTYRSIHMLEAHISITSYLL